MISTAILSDKKKEEKRFLQHCEGKLGLMSEMIEFDPDTWTNSLAYNLCLTLVN